MKKIQIIKKINIYKLVLFIIGLGIIPQTSFELYAQNSGNEAQQVEKIKRTIYFIKVGAFKNMNTQKLNYLNNIGSVYTETIDNGFTRVFVGDYATEQIAKEKAISIRKIGFTDAIVGNKEVSATLPTNVAIPQSFASPTTTEKENLDIDQQKSRSGSSSITVDSTAYVIQLVAVDEMPANKFQQFGNLTDLGELLVVKENEKNKLQIGTFKGRENAEKMLAIVKQRGHKNAFIRRK